MEASCGIGFCCLEKYSVVVIEKYKPQRHKGHKDFIYFSFVPFVSLWLKSNYFFEFID
jgi:hypothetical protein